MANPRHGFTLLELLVALAVFGLLMAGLTEGTRFGLTLWHRQTALVAEREQLDAADRTVRQLLSQIERGGRSDRETIVFTGLLPRSVALDTRRADMILRVDPAQGLVLQWTPHRHETPLTPPPPPVVTPLLPGVARLTLAYWQADAKGNAAWRDAWAGNPVPALIKVGLAFGEGDPRHWPDIVIAPVRISAGE